MLPISWKSNDCTSIRDVKIYRKMTSVFKKVGKIEPDFLLNLIMGDFDQAKSFSSYRLRRPIQFAVKLNNKLVYLYHLYLYLK